MNRAKYENLLAESMVESMDMDTLITYAQERLAAAYSEMTEEEFQEELENFGPDGMITDYLTDGCIV